MTIGNEVEQKKLIVRTQLADFLIRPKLRINRSIHGGKRWTNIRGGKSGTAPTRLRGGTRSLDRPSAQRGRPHSRNARGSGRYSVGRLVALSRLLFIMMHTFYDTLSAPVKLIRGGLNWIFAPSKAPQN